jgi:malate dehydrogenase (oxaloacetate-decarboxylating)
MRREGVAPSAVRRAVVLLDSHGLIYSGRTSLDDYKREFALPPEDLRMFGFQPDDRLDLETVIRRVRPTVLVGTCCTPGSFTEGAIREMAQHVRRPVVMPLSNPTSRAEATPADILAWTDGRALVATGSPFEPVRFGNRTYAIGQANNAFVFPGLGLGAIVAEVLEVSDELFLAAAGALSDSVTSARLEQGALYPSQSELRAVSKQIAIKVVHAARDGGVGRALHDEQIEAVVDAAMWFPAYAAYRPVIPAA